MKYLKSLIIACIILLNGILGLANQFDSAVYMNPNIIGDKDISVLDTVIFSGYTISEIYDRRIQEYLQSDVAIFQISWMDGQGMEIQVHKEMYDIQNIDSIEREYIIPLAYKIGQLPRFLLEGINRAVLMKGKEKWSAALGSIYIHVDYEEKMNSEFVQEVLIHEGGHAAIDERYGSTPEWKNAQRKDSLTLSKYASENLQNEDLAESIIFWLALKYRYKRISDNDSISIAESMPHRLAFLDSLNFDVYPLDQPNDFDYLYERIEFSNDLEGAMTLSEFLWKASFIGIAILILVLIRYIIRNAGF